ncbi:MAG: hypothetical protein QM673_02600 [Gordonia sp. (in: high G+C Gram-positive bacteria)]
MGREHLDIDLDAVADLASVLAVAQEALAGISAEVAGVRSAADRAIGTGPGADAFRAGFASAAGSCTDSVGDALRALDEHLEQIRRAGAALADTDAYAATAVTGDATSDSERTTP